MLGKLIKHDFAATWKVEASLDVVLILLGIMTGVMVHFIPNASESVGMSLFMFSFVGVFYMGIIAANVVTIIYLVVRYYRNLYTSEGYLMFTLPVKTDMLVHSKVVTGGVWVFLSYLCTVISIFFAGLGFFTSIDVPREELMEGLREASAVMGFDLSLVTILLVTFLITPVCAVLCMYFCISIGQLWQGHKILGAVLCMIGLYIFNQIVSQAVFIFSGFWQMMGSSGADIDATFGGMYKRMLLILLILTVIQSAIYYVVILFINRRKINLD